MNIKREPRKSILKPTRPSLPFEVEKRREVTPSPENALEDAHYLEHPVSVIIADNSSLRELTEAYSILAARIRSSVPQNFFTSQTQDVHYALFEPLRSDAEALSIAIVRDLGRVFVDPFLPPNSPPATPREKSGLPTPQDSPVPKKGGMTEEQVKYARDLSTVTNSTIKFLTLTLQTPSIYNVFTQKQLDSILTAVLAIPLAESLRSPTARKICGLAISVLQSQRLPDSVLNSAAPRIAFALKRAIEGELGREGKKGATAEALRAVHDLSIYQPGIFVPMFQVYLMTILEALLTPSCALRVLAAHALGGFVLGLTQPEFEFENILCDVSPIVYEFFLRREAGTNSQPTILRSLRTALRTTEPTHHAQGPFWATSVLASLVILLGPALLKDRQALVAFRGTIEIGMKSKKRVVRGVTSTLWGPLIWVWQKWRGSMEDDAGESDEQCEGAAERERVKACFSTMIRMTTHLPVGLSFVGALLGNDPATCRREDLLLALYELGASARQGGESTQRALDLLDRLVNSREEADFYEQWTDTFMGKLVPEPLLSVSPGLLTSDINGAALNPAIDNIVGTLPVHTDVRPLADEERSVSGVWTRVKDAWMICIEQMEMREDDIIPDVLTDIWTGLVRMGLASVEDDSANLLEYVGQCAEVLISIFTNEAIDLHDQSHEGDSDDTLIAGSAEEGNKATDTGAGSAANQRLKLMLVRALWAATLSVLPTSSVMGAVKPMIRFLVKHQPELVPSTGNEIDHKDEALSEWSQFCAQVAAATSMDITRVIWEHDWEWDDKTRARAWRGYARGWVEDSKGSWRDAATILGIPFREDSPWDMSEADLSTWSSLLAYAVDKASKEQTPVSEVLELVVSRIETQHVISLGSTLRVADHLIGMLERHIETCNDLPRRLIELVHEILITSYPPEPRNKVVAIWLLRSLQSSIGNCPAILVVELLENLHNGLCTWIADECALFSTEEYSSEIIPLFQTVLVALEPLPPSTAVLQSLSALFASALQIDLETGALSSEREEALASFTEFWNNNCLALEPPECGWPEGISHALELAFSATVVESPIPDAPLNPDTMPCIDMILSDDDELDVLPRTTTPRRCPANQVPLPFSPPSRVYQNIPTSPVITPRHHTRRTKESQLSDEPRLPSLFSTLSSPPARRGSQHRKSSRQSRTVSGSSAVSTSDDVEKENVCPQSRRVSNAATYLGTKRTFLDADSSPLSAKRRRTESCGSDDSEDAHAVEEALFADIYPILGLGRSPLGTADVNALGLQTPTKRVRATPDHTLLQARTPNSSPIKRRKTQSCKRLVDSGDDDEYLPSSSDVESEEEDETSGSSSPVGPFTPKTVRRKQHSMAIDCEPPSSDDVVTSSSPTRKIRRLARAERLSSGLNVSSPKTSNPTPSATLLRP
ncbi:uncharacterized protein FOMMEDRAFT_148951 [Fomitiporia mediterranea MF3/22]|uniref:uncharacterized protein n=1 Tax=Fomitiporia mediterranea (strain MF3/22) TaxID=694068 RepID=UPI0004408D51|nr:uncharacterized protein FOMMEDRAFT_148951 [Fomitiporia mediterranea MF3/22]EJC98994.1 hypothetical protein FOMMEDRAFT_148951 [Fomitiporia mediterranea MF3/22]